MNKAPKKIWVDGHWQADFTASEGDIQYIRADLVDALVEALEDMANIAECSGNIVRNARAALAKARGEL